MMIDKLKRIFESQPKQCAVCGSTSVHRHEVYYGKNKKTSIKYYLMMYLCPWHHNLGGPECIHQNIELDTHFKRMYQNMFETILLDQGHTEESARTEFIHLIGRNYIERGGLMSDAVTIFEERSENQKMLNKALEEFKSRGIALAKAEKEYRIHLTAKMYELKQDGVAITATEVLAKGDEKIAELRHDRDVARTLYKSAENAINLFKLYKRAIEADLEAQRRGQ